MPNGPPIETTMPEQLADAAERGTRSVGTPRRTIRVPDQLWDAAAAKAGERGESVSDVIRKALERYVTPEVIS